MLVKRFKFLFLLLSLGLASCAGDSKKIEKGSASVYGTKEYIDAFVSTVRPRWYQTVRRFKMSNRNGDLLAHNYFDINPELNPAKKTINVVVTTPAMSQFRYDLDITSGQYYLAGKYCAQEDVTGKYQIETNRPPFSFGIVPRYLDQTGQPQKVIVFGGEDYIKKYHRTHYFDVRIIGGYIEQECPQGGCLDASDWNSRLVLVAVQNGNKEFEKITVMRELMDVVNWQKVEAFISNGQGKNFLAGKFFQAIRVGSIVDADRAISFLDQNSIFFSVDKMKQMRISCYKLYDHLWKDLSYVAPIERKAKTKEEIKEIAVKVKKGEGRKGTRAFYKRFITAFINYNREYKTCSKYVYPANINYDEKRLWFFAYLTAFHKLHDLGYYYDCRAKNWMENPLIDNKKRSVPIRQQFSRCTAKSMDKAMPMAIQFLNSRQNKKIRSFRFVTYDQGRYGTHSKLYSWVPVGGKQRSCEDSRDSDFEAKLPSFPSDIRWKKRATSGKTKTSLGDLIF